MNNLASLRQLVGFLKIVETGSFSAAAEVLDVSASAMSKSLSALEEKLGLQLLQRTTRGMTPTEAGRFLYERSAWIMEQLGSTLDEAENFKTSLHGMLRITASIAFGSTQLVTLANQFHASHPDIALHIELDDNALSLTDGNFDLALRITQIPPEHYAARKLASAKWIYCASPTYLARHGRPETLADLKLHACLVYPAFTDNGYWSYAKEGQVHRHAVKAALEANSSIALLNGVLQHMGVSFLPTYLAGPHIASGELETLFPGSSILEKYSLYALYSANRYGNPRLRAFLDFLIKELAAPAWDGLAQNSAANPGTSL